MSPQPAFLRARTPWRGLICALLCVVLTACQTVFDPAVEDQKLVARLAHRQTSDAAEQVRRFGAYAQVADAYWTGRWFKGELYGIEYRWIVPGVVLEEVQHQGAHKARMRLYWEPASATLTKIDYLTGRILRDIRVLPTGEVIWPSQLGGVIGTFHVVFSQDQVMFRYGEGTASAKRSTAAEFEAQKVASDAQLRDRTRQEREESNRRWDTVTTGVAAATSSAAQAHGQAQQPATLRPTAPSASTSSTAAPSAPSSAVRQAASKLHGRPPAPTTVATRPSTSASPQRCSAEPVTHVLLGRNSSEDAARGDVQERARRTCQGLGSLGSLRCSSTRDIKVDAKGKQQDLGTRTHECVAVLSCGTKDVCRGGGAAGASAQ